MKKLAYLEGLRGVAALVVVIYHFLAIFTPQLLRALLLDLLILKYWRDCFMAFPSASSKMALSQ